LLSSEWDIIVSNELWKIYFCYFAIEYILIGVVVSIN
jgi:hypothetical protein